MNLTFDGLIWIWKGPAPWFFVTVPPEQCAALHAIAQAVTYGWGVVPVTVQIGASRWQTSLFPKDGAYLVPIKASIRKTERIADGDTVTVRLEVRA